MLNCDNMKAPGGHSTNSQCCQGASKTLTLRPELEVEAGRAWMSISPSSCSMPEDATETSTGTCEDGSHGQCCQGASKTLKLSTEPELHKTGSFTDSELESEGSKNFLLAQRLGRLEARVDMLANQQLPRFDGRMVMIGAFASAAFTVGWSMLRRSAPRPNALLG